MAFIPANNNGQATSANSAPVVLASDQSTLNVMRPDITTTGSASANATPIGQLTLTGHNTYIFNLSGTFVATIQVQISIDGTIFNNVTSNSSIWGAVTGTSQSASITAGGTYRIDCTGYAAIRVITTAYTSGTVNVIARATYAPHLMSIEGIAQVSQQGTVTTSGYLGPNTSSATLISLTNANLSALTLIKNSTGRLHRLTIYNPGTAMAWFQIFNKASTASVALGTDPPVITLPIPANGGVYDQFYTYSDSFSAGIVVAATTTATGGTVSSTGLVVNLGYV